MWADPRTPPPPSARPIRMCHGTLDGLCVLVELLRDDATQHRHEFRVRVASSRFLLHAPLLDEGGRQAVARVAVAS